jgi:hypothetical protein
MKDFGKWNFKKNIICNNFLKLFNKTKNSNNIFEKLEKLGINKNDCIVLGSGILNAKNIRQSKDVDLLVGEEIFEKLKQDNSWNFEVKLTKNGINREALKKDGYDIKKDFWISNEDSELISDFDLFEKYIETEKINGWTFVSLKTILSAKSQQKREKDLEDCKLIKEYLKNNL